MTKQCTGPVPSRYFKSAGVGFVDAERASPIFQDPFSSLKGVAGMGSGHCVYQLD